MSHFDEQDLLSRELHERSQDVGGHPIDLAHVRTRARGIQRRRRIVTGTVAAAVLAVTVPAGVLAGDNLNRSQNDPVVQPSQSVTESATPLPDGPVRLTLDGLERGNDPKVRYIAGRELVEPDGAVTELDDDYTAVTPYADGWLASRLSGGLAFLDQDGQTQRTQAGSGFAADPSGTWVAYVTDAESQDGGTELVFAPTIGAESAKARFPVAADVHPVGFLSPEEVVWQGEGVTPEAGITPVDGAQRRLQGLRKVTAVNAATGRVAGMIRSTPDGSCSGVMEPDASTRSLLWETCDYYLEEFSPDGRFLLGSDPYQSGSGFRSLTVLDAQTAEPLVELRQPRDGQVSLTQVAWEDDRTALAVANEGTSWTVLRIDLGGGLEQATDIVEGDPYTDFPFWLTPAP